PVRQFMATAWQYAVVEREFCFERAACRRVGLVFVSGRGRPAWRYQQSLAALRFGESTLVRYRALPGDNNPNQDAKDKIPAGHSGAALFHVRGNVFGRLFEDFLRRSKNWLPERRGVDSAKQHRSERGQGSATGPAGCGMAIRRFGSLQFSSVSVLNRTR